ncbi:nuclear transport factor 2 family protein [Burkholderia sp. S171]|uniref:nuclear transport factor 2 family protein n=1 Tax=Burkholderia sp. S171 TaxID=1641860 RepID=UPI0020B1510C|nr:nuclear transport factor 2 family protein [Burkholderia sp. S171]
MLAIFYSTDFHMIITPPKMPFLRRTLAATALLAMVASHAVRAEDSAMPANTPTRNVAQEESNRALVVRFYDTVFNQHDLSIASTVLAPNYIQHNPHVPSGSAPFISFFTERFKANPEAHSTIVHSAADGDLVFLHVHSTSNPQDRGNAIVDIFRVDHGTIAEHWDVIQPVPEHAANDNTMF